MIRRRPAELHHRLRFPSRPAPHRMRLAGDEAPSAASNYCADGVEKLISVSPLPLQLHLLR